jgi:hypothetical protein
MLKTILTGLADSAQYDDQFGCATAFCINGGLEVGVSASMPGDERGFLLSEAE